MSSTAALITNASWRWRSVVGFVATVAALSLAVALGSARTAPGTSQALAAPAAAAAPGTVSPALLALAERAPAERLTGIVQLRPDAARDVVGAALRASGISVLREIPLIHGIAVRGAAGRIAAAGTIPGVRAISPDAAVEKTSTIDAGALATSFNQSVRAHEAWAAGYKGQGIGIAVIDTGIQGNLPDFKGDNGASRVVGSVVVNPAAENASDSFGHGTHIAGLAAGDGTQRSAGDPLRGRYAGVAPEANLIAVKADDGHGAATVLDVIDGLQFVVDKKDELGIRVVNLSLASTVAESHLTDPLDAAVEATWFSGIVVVVAAGNRGAAADAVNYAPANDPWVITVGGVDDRGTKKVEDDQLATWSSRGTTQDGHVKPDVVAPGARLISTIPAGSDYTQQCPTCVVDREYFRVGGTSMAAGVASGAVATILSAHPDWTPDQVKLAVVRRGRAVENASVSDGVVVDAQGDPQPQTTSQTLDTPSAEIAIDRVLKAYATTAPNNANRHLQVNQLLDPTTRAIDYNRTSWSRTSWSEAVGAQRTSWSRTSWSRTSWSRTSWSATERDCVDLERTSWSRTSWSSEDMASARASCDALLTAVDPTRTSWSRTSWSRTSWSSSFEK